MIEAIHVSRVHGGQLKGVGHLKHGHRDRFLHDILDRLRRQMKNEA